MAEKDRNWHKSRLPSRNLSAARHLDFSEAWHLYKEPSVWQKKGGGVKSNFDKVFIRRHFLEGLRLPCPSWSSCHRAWDMQDVICTGQLFSRDLIWRLERSYKWNAFLWWFKLVSMGVYLWLRRFRNIHPPSLKLLPLMKVTTCRQRENKKFQYGSAQQSKLFYIQKQGPS